MLKYCLYEPAYSFLQLTMSDNEKMENQRKDEKFEKAGENCAQTSR
jgi:hypothetical protein